VTSSNVKSNFLADITGRRKEVIDRAATYHNKALKEAGGTGEIIPVVSDQAGLGLHQEARGFRRIKG
jgi:hypothetical protein